MMEEKCAIATRSATNPTRTLSRPLRDELDARNARPAALRRGREASKRYPKGRSSARSLWSLSGSMKAWLKCRRGGRDQSGRQRNNGLGRWANRSKPRMYSPAGSGRYREE